MYPILNFTKNMAGDFNSQLDQDKDKFRGYQNYRQT